MYCVRVVHGDYYHTIKSHPGQQYMVIFESGHEKAFGSVYTTPCERMFGVKRGDTNIQLPPVWIVKVLKRRHWLAKKAMVPAKRFKDVSAYSGRYHGVIVGCRSDSRLCSGS